VTILPETSPVAGGVYQHCKSDLYTVEGFAVHHEMHQKLVLYRSHEKA
jgi:hypothetical protein